MMRVLVRHWTKIVAWFSTKQYLVNRHQQIKTENQHLRQSRTADSDASEELRARCQRLLSELDDALQRIKDLESDHQSDRRTIELMTAEHMGYMAREERRIATETSRRIQVLRDSEQREEPLM